MLKKLSAILCAVILIIAIISESSVLVYAAPYKDHKIGAGKNIIEAEDFDTDDWYDETEGTYAYRSDGAQTENCSNYERDDAPDYNYDIGWSADGEWVQYTVNVEAAGKYKFEVWLASQSGNGGVEIFYDGKSIGSAVAEDSTDWQDWVLCSVGQIEMTAGKHIIKVEFTVSVNMDAIIITSLGNETTAGNIIVNCTCEHDFNAIIEEYMRSIENEADKNKDGGEIFTGYAAAEDLSEIDTLYTVTVISIIIAVISLAVASSAIIFAFKTAKKIKI